MDNKRISPSIDESLQTTISLTNKKKENNEDAVKVEIRIVFLILHDIETIQEKFTAEIYLESKWLLDNRVEMIPDVENLNVDTKWEPKWKPDLKIINIINESKVETWYKIENIDNKYYVYEMKRMKATFYEKLELGNYPFDVQRLNINIVSMQPSSKCLLFQNETSPSYILLDNFHDSQEWHLYNFVGVEEKGRLSSKFSVSNRVHSTIKFYCVVARKPGYFYWNAFYLIFIISALSFNIFSLPYTSTPQRMQSTTTLILTSVSFKWIVNRSLPPIAYLTMLDVYSILIISFMAILTTWHAIIGYFFASGDSTMLDKIFLIVVASVYVTGHLIFIFYIFFYGFRPRRYYSSQESNYEKKVSKIREAETSQFIEKNE